MPSMDPDALRAAGMAEEAEEIANAIQEGARTVAVISKPYGGRQQLLDRIAEELERDEHRLEVSTAPGHDDIPDTGFVTVRECQHLFERRIGGFDDLDAFIDALLETEATVVTAWNRYTWNYIHRVRELEQVFDDVIELATFNASQFDTYLEEAGLRGGVTFQDDREVNTNTISWTTATFDVAGRQRSVPYPYFDVEGFRNRRSTDKPFDEFLLGRIIDRADGIPGVAQAIWEQSIEDGSISLNTLVEPPDVEITEEEAFILRDILMDEEQDVDTLRRASIVDRLEPHLRALKRGGLIDVTDGIVSLLPRGIPTALDELEKRRLVW